MADILIRERDGALDLAVKEGALIPKEMVLS